MSVKFCASLTIRDMRKLRPLLSDSAIGLEPEGGEVADETVIVNTAPATSEPVQPISTPSPQAIDQATQFGEMREAFKQTQGEVGETRSGVAGAPFGEGVSSEAGERVGELAGERPDGDARGGSGGAETGGRGDGNHASGAGDSERTGETPESETERPEPTPFRTRGRRVSDFNAEAEKGAMLGLIAV